ncbi:SDR family oxidoreductase [Nonomuraea soli]|uniref:3-oxoacyl-[acyl-carrier protein] reductase n=1 Tax=Nonomuraea soli TaxID=1032476 RepID=A0A7W0HRX9_9ACTN|nr:SDR family oxidoreductase [Nonomuraea soli]MBA2893425.1 3-oxoacyl-[acyl-carrier protein] reductase [Nonomuraea soli]
MGTLSGKHAVVTGGSRGIGRAIVERLCAEGAQVVFTYLRNEAAAEQVSVRTGAQAVRIDLGRRADVDLMFAEARRRLGRLDILVNNAAMNDTGVVSEYGEELYDQMMATNTKAVFLAMQWAARTMREGGRIVNISTLNTDLPAPGTAVYAASKAAVEQFARVLAREVGPRGITVNSVSPGAVDTELLHSTNTPEALAQVQDFTALRRIGQPDDIAGVVAFLAGPDGRWITGQTIRATGGLLL